MADEGITPLCHILNSKNPKPLVSDFSMASAQAENTLDKKNASQLIGIFIGTECRLVAVDPDELEDEQQGYH